MRILFPGDGRDGSWMNLRVNFVGTLTARKHSEKKRQLKDVFYRSQKVLRVVDGR